ncbi:MAG TPA: type II toxin-antitoxin system VapB family antitoxin [Ramlibacter sp.]|jgi:hypothetical protein|nr:type II toxin-antitoxin system VapB family antitoxin [Ramlibacter sp.]
MTTRTNIVLDDDLVAQAMRRAGVKTKRAAVEAALRAFVKKPDYSGLLALIGTDSIDDDYDPKALFHEPVHVAEPRPHYRAAKTKSKSSARSGARKRSR